MSGLCRSKLQLKWDGPSVLPRLGTATSIAKHSTQQLELLQRTTSHYVDSRRFCYSAEENPPVDYRGELFFEESDKAAAMSRAHAESRFWRIQRKSTRPEELTAIQMLALLPYLSLARDSVFAEVSSRTAARSQSPL